MLHFGGQLGRFRTRTNMQHRADMGGKLFGITELVPDFFQLPITPMKREETEDVAEQAKRAGNSLFL